MVAVAELRARPVRYHERGEFTVDRRALDAARCVGRSRDKYVAHDAWHRLLLDHRNRQADIAGSKAWLRGCFDAAAFLL